MEHLISKNYKDPLQSYIYKHKSYIKIQIQNNIYYHYIMVIHYFYQSHLVDLYFIHID